MAVLTVGQAAPAFSLKGLDGKSFTLYKDDARMTLVVFFKTTCPTCAMVFPYIEKIHRAYRADGLSVWGISQHDSVRSSDFATKYASTFPVLIDADWRVSKQYDPEYVPTSFLIDSNSRIIECVIAFNKAELNRISQVVAARLGVAVVTIAAEDTNPPFKPG
jgi:peroxiredoxin